MPTTPPEGLSRWRNVAVCVRWGIPRGPPCPCLRRSRAADWRDLPGTSSLSDGPPHPSREPSWHTTSFARPSSARRCSWLPPRRPGQFRCVRHRGERAVRAKGAGLLPPRGHGAVLRLRAPAAAGHHLHHRARHPVAELRERLSGGDPPLRVFAVDYRGAIVLPAAGTYRFRLDSDDGSRLLIDGRQVIDNDGVHGENAVEGTAELAGGGARGGGAVLPGPALRGGAGAGDARGDEGSRSTSPATSWPRCGRKGAGWWRSWAAACCSAPTARC